MTIDKDIVGQIVAEHLNEEPSIPSFWKFSYNPADQIIQAVFSRPNDSDEGVDTTIIRFQIQQLVDCDDYDAMCKWCAVEAFHVAVEIADLHFWEKNPALLN